MLEQRDKSYLFLLLRLLDLHNHFWLDCLIPSSCARASAEDSDAPLDFALWTRVDKIGDQAGVGGLALVRALVAAAAAVEAWLGLGLGLGLGSGLG